MNFNLLAPFRVDNGPDTLLECAGCGATDVGSNFWALQCTPGVFLCENCQMQQDQHSQYEQSQQQPGHHHPQSSVGQQQWLVQSPLNDGDTGQQGRFRLLNESGYFWLRRLIQIRHP